MMKSMNGFYEEDEPIADVIAAFERGEKGVTERPARGQTAYLVEGHRTVAARRVETRAHKQGQTETLAVA